MVQIVSISKARSNLSSLVTQVAQTKQPVIIIRASSPVVVIQPIKERQSRADFLKKLASLDTSWFTKKDEEDYKNIRKEVENRIKKLHNEK